MAQFKEFQLTVTNVEALDKIALDQGGVVARCQGGYTITKEIAPVGDWGFRWVNTQGTGNTGTLVLIPTSPRTKHLAFEGHVRAIVSRLGVDRETARAIAGTRAPYLREDAVLDALAQMLTSWAGVSEIAAREVFTRRNVFDLGVTEPLRQTLLNLSGLRRNTLKAVAATLVEMR